MEVLMAYGLWGLFAASFLAATILPLSSEVVLGYLLVNQVSLFNALTVATGGNVLGALTNYALGRAGARVLLEKVFRLSSKEVDQAQQRFKTHGILCLLLAWVPGIGDPLTVVAGMLKINVWVFLILVALGKLGRYLVVSWAVLSY